MRDVRLGGRDLTGQRLACHAWQRLDLLEGCVDAGSHGAVVSQVQDERPRVNSRQADDAVLGQPVCPLRAAGLAHDDGPHVWRCGLGAFRRDAVVAHHRRREAEDLPGIARVGDELLVAGHRGREDGLTERSAVRAHGLAGEEFPVLEQQSRHPSCAIRPAATVMRTAPLSSWPSSHEFAEREWKTSSVTRHDASVASRTKFASAPASMRGGSSP